MRNTCKPSTQKAGTLSLHTKKNEVQITQHSLIPSLTLSPSHKKTKHKKLSNLFSKEIQKTKFKSQSLSLTRSRALSLTLSFRACRSVAGTVADCSRRRCCFSLPSPSLLLAPVTVAVAASRSRHRRCFSLPSPSPSLPLAVTSKDSFFFL